MKWPLLVWNLGEKFDYQKESFPTDWDQVNNAWEKVTQNITLYFILKRNLVFR